jgi:multiple sugar transport system ATP-binding protein
MAATVRLAAHRRVILDFGTQSISLPRTDRRAMALTHSAGLRVIVGARTDAFTLTPDSGYANELSGRLLALEFHGHQWVAFVESGIELVNPDTIGPTTGLRSENGTTRARADSSRRWSDAGHGTQRPARPSLGARARTAVLRRPPAIPPPAIPVDGAETSPGHRRADLVLEVEPGTNLTVGDTVHLTIDVSRIHIFGQNGHRIDKVIR